jgi:hypothetical protein
MIKYYQIEVDTLPAKCRDNLSHKGKNFMEKGFSKVGINSRFTMSILIINYSISKSFNDPTQHNSVLKIRGL